MRASALAGLLLALAVFFVPAFVAAIGLSLRLGEGAIGFLVVLTSWFCMAVGGALAVLLYRRRLPRQAVSRGMGARLGVVAGLLGFLLYAVPQAVRLAFFHLGGSIRAAMRRAIEHSAAQNPDPNAQELMRNLLTPDALAVFLTVLVVLFFGVFLLLSTIGGAIGASVWGSRDS